MIAQWPAAPLASSSRGVALLVIAALHGAAIAILALSESVHEVLRAPAPLQVALVEAPRSAPPPPPPLPPPRLAPVNPVFVPAPEVILAVAVESPIPAPMVIEKPVAGEEPPRSAPAETPPDFSARYLDNPAPAYPMASRRLREQGRVMLRVLVSALGSAEEIQVRISSGHPRLDEAAVDTVRRWRFVPARRGEQSISAWVVVPVSFRLEG